MRALAKVDWVMATCPRGEAESGLSEEQGRAEGA